MVKNGPSIPLKPKKYWKGRETCYEMTVRREDEDEEARHSSNRASCSVGDSHGSTPRRFFAAEK